MNERRLYEDRDGAVWLQDGNRVWDVTGATSEAMQLLFTGIRWTLSETEDLSDRLIPDNLVARAEYDPDKVFASDIRLFPERAGPNSRRVLGLKNSDDLSRMHDADSKQRAQERRLAAAHNLAIVSALAEAEGIRETTITIIGERDYVEPIQIDMSPPESLQGPIQGLQTVVYAPEGGWTRKPDNPVDADAALIDLAAELTAAFRTDWADGLGGRSTVIIRDGRADIDLQLREVQERTIPGKSINAKRHPLASAPEESAPSL